MALESLIVPWYVLPVYLWSIIWGAAALWKSGKNNQLDWFVLLFILTVIPALGILQIIYICWFQEKPIKKITAHKKITKAAAKKKRRK